MKTGLVALEMPFGHTTTWRIGRLERVEGDEYILTGYRLRSIDTRTPEAVLRDGPEEGGLSEKSVVGVHRLHVLTWVVPGLWAQRLDTK